VLNNSAVQVDFEQVVTSRGGLWVFEHVLGELNFR
jgi:hypothetical protein